MPEALLPPVLLVAVLVLATAVAAGLDRALTAVADGGPVGAAWLDPARECLRLLVQRRRTTVAPDSLLWRVSGGALFAVATLMLAVVPVGDRPVLDLPVGLVWFNTMDVLLWALFWLVGWGPNSAYALVGGYRFLAQALAYELPLMFALTAPAVRAGSLELTQVVAAQHALWNVVLMPAAFLVYLAAVLAFSVLGPFAHPAGADLGGGILAELSGVDRLVVLAGRYALLVAGSAVSVPLFLGGGAGPLLPAPAWTVVKSGAVVVALLLVRRKVPVLRGDRLLTLGWLVLLPLTVAQLLVPSLLAVGGR